MDYKVLLVGSNQANRELIREFLLQSDLDFQITLADHLAMGLESIGPVQPDLVLLDLNANDHDAVNMIKSIHQHEVTRKIPVIVFVSYNFAYLSLSAVA